MRLSAAEAQESRRRIIEGASKLFRERGVRSASVADAMQSAGMTHGGFYRHFESKDALVTAALSVAFDGFALPLEARSAGTDGTALVKQFRQQYLSRAHVENPGDGCPMPSLAGDMAHASEEVRMEFDAGVQRMVDAIASSLEGSPRQRREAAVREVALLVGAVALARACAPQFSEEVLAACRKA